MNLSWGKLSARGEREGVDVYVCAHVFFGHCGFFWLCESLLCVFVCACMFVLLKGLAQRRPFVDGNSGHCAQLIWFVDVSQNCISLQQERDGPSSWCEAPTNVPMLTALNRNWYKHQTCLTCISCCQSINSYINSTQMEVGKQIKTSLWGWFHATAAGEMSRFLKFNCKMYQSVGGQSSADIF